MVKVHNTIYIHMKWNTCFLCSSVGFLFLLQPRVWGLHDKCKPMLVISVKAFVCEIHLVFAFSQLKILKNLYDICHWVAPALITFSYLGLVLSLQLHWKNKKLYFVAKLLTLLRQNVIQWHQVHCTFGDLYVYLKKIQMFFSSSDKKHNVGIFSDTWRNHWHFGSLCMLVHIYSS